VGKNDNHTAVDRNKLRQRLRLQQLRLRQPRHMRDDALCG